MNTNNRDLKSIRNVMYGVATFVALFFLLAFVPKISSQISGTESEPQYGEPWEGNVMLIMFVLYIIGYIIGWWKKLWGGILMLLGGLLVSLPFIILLKNYGSLIFGIPQIIVGILYCYYWNASRHALKT